MENFENATHVIAPAGCSPYLNAGRCYKLALKDLEKKAFVILDDSLVALICKAQSCVHLNGQDWIFIE